jgi:hypothetical protein
VKKIILVLVLLIVHSTLYIEHCSAQVWSPLGSGINDRVSALTVFNNELIAGGSFTTAGGVSANRIAKWNGMSWIPLGSGMDSAVYALTVYNNELIAAGWFTIAGGISCNRIAKWNGTNWSSIGTGMNDHVLSLIIYNNELIAGGYFTIAGGDSAKRIAKWNGTTWSSLGNGIGGVLPFNGIPYVSAMTIFNNNLYVGGRFTTAGGYTGHGVAIWNGTNWSIFTEMLDYINCLAVYNNEPIAGALLLYTNFYIARYTGSGWSPLGSSFDNFIGPPYALISYNNELIAGGDITVASGDSVHNITKWNGTNWSTIGGGVNGIVNALTIYNNALITGGNFTTAGGVSVNRIAKWGPGFSISGNVRYSDNNQPATNGYVKAIKLDRNTGNIITFDSVQIQANGNYSLTNVPQDSVDIGVYPNSTTNNDWVITYYPSTTYWQDATTLYPTGNMTNVNIGVKRLTSSSASNSVNGKVMRLTDSQIGNLKDAVLYAKNGNTFVRCAISNGNGVYHLPSLPAGSLKIICNRFGFTNDSAMVNITPTSNIDSINFHLYRVQVGIKKISEIIPSEYKLYQNYPNPFNPTTNIRYQITNNKLVTLKIYDILGKEVADFVNEKQSSGVYEVTFNGSGLSSGIYFYKLTAGDYLEVKRMILIK